MTNIIETIPELLVKTRGNQSDLARKLGISRLTLKKYINDKGMKEHVIINGVLMTISQRHTPKKSISGNTPPAISGR